MHTIKSQNCHTRTYTMHTHIHARPCASPHSPTRQFAYINTRAHTAAHQSAKAHARPMSISTHSICVHAPAGTHFAHTGLCIAHALTFIIHSCSQFWLKACVFFVHKSSATCMHRHASRFCLPMHSSDWFRIDVCSWQSKLEYLTAPQVLQASPQGS